MKGPVSNEDFLRGFLTLSIPPKGRSIHHRPTDWSFIHGNLLKGLPPTENTLRGPLSTEDSPTLHRSRPMKPSIYEIPLEMAFIYRELYRAILSIEEILKCLLSGRPSM